MSSILSIISTAFSGVTSLVTVWVQKIKNNNTDAMKANDRAKKIATIKAKTRQSFDKGDVEKIERGTSK